MLIYHSIPNYWGKKDSKAELIILKLWLIILINKIYITILIFDVLCT